MKKLVASLFVVAIATISGAAPVGTSDGPTLTFKEIAENQYSITLDQDIKIKLTSNSTNISVFLDDVASDAQVDGDFIRMTGDIFMKYNSNETEYMLNAWIPRLGGNLNDVTEKDAGFVTFSDFYDLDFYVNDEITITKGTMVMTTPNVDVILPENGSYDLFLANGITGKRVSDNITVKVIPEPATFGLLGLAGAGLAVCRRRFSK